jgi:hypothetical protein
MIAPIEGASAGRKKLVVAMKEAGNPVEHCQTRKRRPPGENAANSPASSIRLDPAPERIGLKRGAAPVAARVREATAGPLRTGCRQRS